MASGTISYRTVDDNVHASFTSGSPAAVQDRCRIYTDARRLDGALIDRFRALPATVVGDAMDRLGVMHADIHAVTGERSRCVGSAVTVLTRAGDNLAIHAALDAAEPGDVLVVNGQAGLSQALFGGLMARRARRLEVAGLVVDGVVRDIDEIRSCGLPVWARGVAPGGPFKDGPGIVGRPVACGGVVCASGDIVVADASGVAIVPAADALAILERSLRIAEWESSLEGGEQELTP